MKSIISCMMEPLRIWSCLRKSSRLCKAKTKNPYQLSAVYFGLFDVDGYLRLSRAHFSSKFWNTWHIFIICFITNISVRVHDIISIKMLQIRLNSDSAKHVRHFFWGFIFKFIFPPKGWNTGQNNGKTKWSWFVDLEQLSICH